MAFFLIAVLLVTIPVKSIAEETGQGDKKNASESRRGIEFFLGNTHDDGEEGLSVGLSYEYRLTQMFGIGGLGINAQCTFGGFEKALVAELSPRGCQEALEWGFWRIHVHELPWSACWN